jgi:hypothetical protein
MKTIEITLNSEGDFEKVNAFLSQLKLEKELKITESNPVIDPITLYSEESLSEEWDSKEDKRWDSLL